MQTATLIIGRKRPPRNLKMAELRTAFEDRRPCRQVNSTHPLHLLLPAIINRNRTCGEEGKRSHSVEATVTHATHNTICRQRTGGTHRTPVSIALGGLDSLQPSQKSRLPALSHVTRSGSCKCSSPLRGCIADLTASSTSQVFSEGFERCRLW